jgi:hypothetical protein
MAKTKWSEKFSFGQLTANSDGKTSGSGVAGLYIILIGGVTFLGGCISMMFIPNSIDIITQSIVFTGIGAGLLGLRKFKASTDKSKFEVDEKDDTLNS